MAVDLYRDDTHRVIAFNDLMRSEGGAQANQFLNIHGAQSALIDPCGALLYTPPSMAVWRYLQPRELTYILASCQDPGIIGSVDPWLVYTDAKIVCSRLQGRFTPHSVPHYPRGSGPERYILLSDTGALAALGGQLPVLGSDQPDCFLRG